MGRGCLTKLFLFLFALLPFYSFANAQSRASGVTIMPNEYDLGEVGHEDRILGIATITNPGQQQCTIRSIRSNCACYKVPRTARALLPGKSILVEFDLTFPRDRELHNPVIYVLTDDKEKPMRTLVMKMSLTDKQAARAREPGEIVIQLAKPEAVSDGSIESFNREMGVVRVEEISSSGSVKGYALRLGAGASVEQTARNYLKRPEVSLAFLRASEGTQTGQDILGASGGLSVPPLTARLPSIRRRISPLAIRWFYSEGCAFCDDVKRLLGQIWASFPART